MAAHHPPPLLDSGRHPFELFVLFLGLVSGLPLVWGAPAPSTTTALLGPTWVHVWGGMFAGGCAVALIGVLWAWPGWPRLRMPLKAETGLLIELVGLVGLGVSTTIYVVGVFRAGPPTTPAPHGLPPWFVPVALVLALGVASLWRAWQIRRWVKAAIRDQQGR